MGVFWGGQPRRWICTNASRGLSVSFLLCRGTVGKFAGGPKILTHPGIRGVADPYKLNCPFPQMPNLVVFDQTYGTVWHEPTTSLTHPTVQGYILGGHRNQHESIGYSLRLSISESIHM